MEKFKEYAALAWSKVTDVVRKYPVRSFLASLSLGFILGAWLL